MGSPGRIPQDDGVRLRGGHSISTTAWVRLILSIRLLATANAVVLLIVHRLTNYDGVLIVAVCGYSLAVVMIAVFVPGLASQPLAWLADSSAALALVAVSGDWRSPFFLLAVTTLVTPAIAATARVGVTIGCAFSAMYLVLAHFVGPDPLRIGRQTTVETLATHLTLPVLVAFGAAAVAEALRQLRAERARSERLAIDAERRRIAWELHDSAKARVHAAHLVLSALRDTPDGSPERSLDLVLDQLEAAAADMDTSLEELRSPLEGRPLDVALRAHIAEFTLRHGPRFKVRGSIENLDPLTAAHAFRIASEAVINAARHAAASRVEVNLSEGAGGADVVVIDDGRGMPAGGERVANNGLRNMHNRARTIGGALRIDPRADGPGTVVALHIPHVARGAQHDSHRGRR